MQDVTSRLAGLALDDEPATEPSIIEADLARGRRALRRRRGRTQAGCAVAALAAAGALAYAGTQPTAHKTPTAGSSIATQQSVPSNPGIRLVSYSGRQLPGFKVTLIPNGWKLQGADEHVLVIAPKADRTSMDDFTGKLLVTANAPDSVSPLAGKPVIVNGQQGAIKIQGLVHPGDSRTLRYYIGTRQVVIQCPKTLGWSDAQLVSFAEGVRVTANLKPVSG
jgi:hypothetical protein